MAEADVERLLREEMEAFSARATPSDMPLTAWRPVGAYPSDYGRRHALQDLGPEWDFKPADERWD